MLTTHLHLAPWLRMELYFYMLAWRVQGQPPLYRWTDFDQILCEALYGSPVAPFSAMYKMFQNLS
jgi:hypothetical protein